MDKFGLAIVRDSSVKDKQKQIITNSVLEIRRGSRSKYGSNIEFNLKQVSQIQFDAKLLYRVFPKKYCCACLYRKRHDAI